MVHKKEQEHGLIYPKKAPFFRYSMNTKYCRKITKQKLKSNRNTIKLLFDSGKNLVVAPSAVQRAMLKTEATLAGINNGFICNSENEALLKLVKN